jgi:hypothetical protein
MTETKLWSLVNSAVNFEQISRAEMIVTNALDQGDIDREVFDDMMMTLAYISRERHKKMMQDNFKR